jgi:SAM-dependent methyltransferase
MEWPKQFFDRTWLEYGFELVSRQQTQEEITFIEKALNLRRNESVLDLCCGIGRHSIGLAKKGYRMTGIDFNRDYIKKAKSLSMNMRLRPTFIDADMRTIPFINKFEATICMWSSFGYFNEETDLDILRGVAKALRNGGRFLLEVANRDYILRHFQPRDWVKAGKGYIMEKRVFHSDTSRLLTTWIFAGGGGITRKRSDVRLYSLYELEKMLPKAGFRVTARYGDINRTRPSLYTPRLLLVSRK